MKRSLFQCVLVAILCFICSSAASQVQVETITQPLQGSGGLCLDDNNRLYISDFGQSLDSPDGTTIRRRLPDGTIEIFATGFSGASGNFIDEEGFIFQSNIAGNRVDLLDQEGNQTLYSRSRISCNVGVVGDVDGNIFVCNCCGNFANTITRISADKIATTYSQSTIFSCPNGITINPVTQDLYVSNFGNGDIIRVDTLGNPSVLATLPSSPGNLPSNGHIVFDDKLKVLYAASHGAHQIFKVHLDGRVELVAGSGDRGNQDGEASVATFSRPNGLALSKTGDTLYVNSSIPTTNSNGRPLNPSVIRMITGLKPSKTSALKYQDDGNLLIGPNPFQNSLIVFAKKAQFDAVTIEVRGTGGELLLQEEIPALELGNRHLLDFSNFQDGCYIVTVRSISNTFSNAVVKMSIGH